MLDFAAVEKRIAALPGVAAVAMNAGSTTATIEFDEALTNPGAMTREIEACGFHCRGEIAPRHLCVPGGGSVLSFVLSPEIAALAMSGSSALVAINALLLKRTRLDGIRPAASTTSGPARELPTTAPA